MTEDGDQIANPDFADPIKNKKPPRPVPTQHTYNTTMQHEIKRLQLPLKDFTHSRPLSQASGRNSAKSVI